MNAEAPPPSRGPWSGLRHLVHRLWPFIARRFWLLAAALAITAVYGFVANGRVALVPVLLNQVLGTAGPHWTFVTLGLDRWGLLVGLCAVAAAIALAMGILGYLHKYLTVWFLARVITDLQLKVCAHLLTLSMSFFNRNRVGELMSRLTSDVGVMGGTLTFIFDDLVLQPIKFLTAAAWCFIISWQLALLVFVGLPLVVVPIIHFGRLTRRRARRRQETIGEVVTAMHQMFTGIRVVKAFGAEPREEARFREKNELALSRNLRVVRTKMVSRSLVETINNLAVPAVLLVGGACVLNHWLGLDVGRLGGFIFALALMYEPLRVFSRAYGGVQESLAGADRVFQILDERPEMQDAPDAIEPDGVREAIRFEGVCFRYEQDPVLMDVRFEARAGEVVAIVGHSGAGKSTLLDLLARFYDPDAGRITIDGVDLRHIRREALTRLYSVVTQEPFLFHTTLRENIRYARPRASDADVEAAARAANIADFIASLPMGYDTEVGERGMTISGGQRQRVAIARAVLKDTAILLLDEATSSLDSESEREVQRALETLMQGRTTFVIAHRLSTILGADRIIVLERGRVVGQGRHEDLLRSCPTYEHLYRLQFGAAAATPPAEGPTDPT